LIDGKRLASLMIEYNLGVGIQETYIIKRIDQDYFVKSIFWCNFGSLSPGGIAAREAW